MPYEGSEPKSGCTYWRNESMRAMYAPELGSTGSDDTSWFQALSDGKTEHPPRVAPPCWLTTVTGSGESVTRGVPSTGAAGLALGVGAKLGEGIGVKTGLTNSGCASRPVLPGAVVASDVAALPHAVADSAAKLSRTRERACEKRAGAATLASSGR